MGGVLAGVMPSLKYHNCEVPQRLMEGCHLMVAGSMQDLQIGEAIVSRAIGIGIGREMLFPFPTISTRNDCNDNRNIMCLSLHAI